MKKEIEDKILKCKTDKQVLSALKNYNIKNVSEEYGYFNIRIYTENGYIRVYKKAKQYIVQSFTPCKMEYSGVPTFFASSSYF